MTNIEQIRLREILDSRGNSTVEAEIWTLTGWGRAAAPSGASTGTYEAKVRPVPEAIREAEEKLIPALVGEDARDQIGFDSLLREIDSTPDFSKIGANVAVALSMACARAAAATLNMELFRYLGGVFTGATPLPLGNVIGGGAHAVNATEIQEFLVVPTGAADAEEAVFANAAVHRKVRELLSAQGLMSGKGDEGAWAPQISDAQAFDLLSQAVEAVSDILMLNINIGVDVAASQLFNGEAYGYREKSRSTEEQITYIAEVVDTYGLVYVEDPLHEEDFEGFAELTRQIGDRCLVCGDDLFVTQVERIIRGIETGAANCVLIKPNQIGTLTDTYEAVRVAQTHGLDTVMSHRSGETTDDTIAHLATAFGCIFLKTGVVGGERTAKLNELIRIEEAMQ
ncbi:MAG: phosphopyruvate hydratase [Methanomicrobiales archaeon]|nr:phosphopyruvate hydratase [Methanomicrobiales archaeon]